MFKRQLFSSNHDTYECLKKLCYYTINYGPAYVNEIYTFLSTSKLLESFDKDIINIYSLGSGFSPDFIAMEKYIQYNSVNFSMFYYFGFDIEPFWREITQDAVPILADLTAVPINYNNVDIIFINKLFSTLKNHNLHDNFLTRLREDLQTLPSSSYIVFNDINNYQMGRDEFDQFITPEGFNIVNKFFFDIENAYTDNYTPMPTNTNVCEIPDNLTDKLNQFDFSPKITPNKTNPNCQSLNLE